MRRKLATIGPLLFFLLWTGCAPLVLRLNPSLISHMTQSLFEECDPELAEQALPGSLKLLEGLHRSDPGNKQILSALSQGFGGYALLFLEAEAPERASRFYLRSRDYALRALGNKGASLENPAMPEADFRLVLAEVDKRDLDALFWFTFSWSGWIQLNLDKPAALAQLGSLQACLERVLELDPTFFHGLPNILQGVILAAKPSMLGGDRDRARVCFENALSAERDRDFFPAQYYYARHYAVATQDRELFLRLLNEILQADAGAVKEVCLINAVIQRKAAALVKQVDELFY